MVLLCNSTVSAYQVIEVLNGGTISGRISFAGELPANAVIKTTKNTGYCGSRINADYYMGTGGGLQNMVVVIEDISRDKKYRKRGVVKVNNEKCKFSNHVTVAV